MSKVHTWSDKKCMEKFFELLSERVQISTAFLQNEKTGLLEKQVMVVQCGDISVTSDPDDLPFPLKIADADDIGKENIN